MRQAGNLLLCCVPLQSSGSPCPYRHGFPHLFIWSWLRCPAFCAGLRRGFFASFDVRLLIVWVSITVVFTPQCPGYSWMATILRQH